MDDTHLVMISTNSGGIGVYISLSLVKAVCNECITPSILISIFSYSLIGVKDIEPKLIGSLSVTSDSLTTY